MEQEIWKPVKGFEGLYEVSTYGNVKSVERIVVNINGIVSLYKPLILKFDLCGHNKKYRRVTLSKDNKTKRYLVHRLVAETFIPNPHNKPQVNHIDNIGDNNLVGNLEWCTATENMQHEAKNGRTQQGIKNRGCKLSERQVLEIRELRKTKTKREIAALYNIATATVRECSNGKTWKHLK